MALIQGKKVIPHSVLVKVERAKEWRIVKAKNPKIFYRYLNSKMKFKEKVNAIYRDNGDIINDDSMKVNLFNRYFTTVFKEPEENEEAYPVGYETRCDDLTFDEEGIIKVLKAMQPKTSSGIDGIPSIFYQKLEYLLALPLLLIFNRSYRLGRLPAEWLISKVVPVYKKGQRMEVQNCRPICLTVVGCRIMEKVAKEALVGYLEREGVWSNNQHGFLKKKSTLRNLLLILDNLTAALDRRQKVDVVYIDIAKAFNTISHSILLNRLYDLRVHKTMVSWTKCFVTERKQTVCLKGFIQGTGV